LGEKENRVAASRSIKKSPLSHGRRRAVRKWKAVPRRGKGPGRGGGKLTGTIASNAGKKIVSVGSVEGMCDKDPKVRGYPAFYDTSWGNFIRKKRRLQ